MFILIFPKEYYIQIFSTTSSQEMQVARLLGHTARNGKEI